MGTSSFFFDMNDLKDDASFSRAVGRNQVNVTPDNKVLPLRTTSATSEVPQRSITTWGYSDIMQGAAALKPTGATYDVFNQSLSNDLVGILNNEGEINDLLGGRASFAPWDVVARGQFGARSNSADIEGIVAGATDPSGMGAAGSGERQVKTVNGTIIVVDVQGITVNKTISGAVDKMLTAAKGAGITLTGSGWRSHERQIQLRKDNGCPDVWTASPSACRVPTAIPGKSKHEEGLAIDFDNMKSRSTRGFNWLMSNAATYGFKNLPSEPWHWSTTGG